MLIIRLDKEMRTRGSRVYDRSGVHKMSMVRMLRCVSKVTDELPNVQSYKPEVIEMLLTPKLCGLVRKSKICGHEIPYVVTGNITQDRIKGST